MNIREHVTQTVDSLSEPELHLVAEYISFLKFRSRVQSKTTVVEESLAQLYAEFSNEDLELAEGGIEDFNTALLSEDNK